MNQPLTIEKWVPFFWRAFLTAVVIWMVASVIVAATQVQSSNAVVTIRDMALPVWVGCLAGIACTLMLRTLRNSQEAPTP